MSKTQALSRAELAAAGRRKLEEFRKQRAAGKAPTSQPAFHQAQASKTAAPATANIPDAAPLDAQPSGLVANPPASALSQPPAPINTARPRSLPEPELEKTHTPQAWSIQGSIPKTTTTTTTTVIEDGQHPPQLENNESGDEDIASEEARDAVTDLLPHGPPSKPGSPQKPWQGPSSTTAAAAGRSGGGSWLSRSFFGGTSAPVSEEPERTSSVDDDRELHEKLGGPAAVTVIDSRDPQQQQGHAREEFGFGRLPEIHLSGSSTAVSSPFLNVATQWQSSSSIYSPPQSPAKPAVGLKNGWRKEPSFHVWHSDVDMPSISSPVRQQNQNLLGSAHVEESHQQSQHHTERSDSGAYISISAAARDAGAGTPSPPHPPTKSKNRLTTLSGAAGEDDEDIDVIPHLSPAGPEPSPSPSKPSKPSTYNAYSYEYNNDNNSRNIGGGGLASAYGLLADSYSVRQQHSHSHSHPEEGEQIQRSGAEVFQDRIKAAASGDGNGLVVHAISSYKEERENGAMSGDEDRGRNEEELFEPPAVERTGVNAGSGANEELTRPKSTTSIASDVSRVLSVSDLAAQNKANNAKFRELQKHIDELTQEKFALQRALDSQSKLAQRLSQETDTLMQGHNDRTDTARTLRAENAVLKKELAARSAAALAAAAQRDAYETAAREATERQKSLAAEVIALEERLLKLRSEELRNKSEASGASEVARAMRAQLEDTSRERTELLRQLQALRDENAELRSIQQHQAYLGSSYNNNNNNASNSGGLTLRTESSEATAASIPTSSRIAGKALADLAAIPEENSTEGQENADQQLQQEPASVLPSEVLCMLPQGLILDTTAPLNTNPLKTIDASAMLQASEAIYAMLDAIEADKREQREEVMALREANRQLMGRIETMQQRLELAAQQQVARTGTRDTEEG